MKPYSVDILHPFICCTSVVLNRELQTHSFMSLKLFQPFRKLPWKLESHNTEKHMLLRHVFMKPPSFGTLIQNKLACLNNRVMQVPLKNHYFFILEIGDLNSFCIQQINYLLNSLRQPTNQPLPPILLIIIFNSLAWTFNIVYPRVITEK